MKPLIELTLSARRHAEHHGLVNLLIDLESSASLMRGDLVEIETATDSEKFVVRSRRHCIATDGSQWLAIELDYPARL